MSLTWRLPDLDVISRPVADLYRGQPRGGDPMLGHHGTVLAVGLQQLPRVVLDEGRRETGEEGTGHGGWCCGGEREIKRGKK